MVCILVSHVNNPVPVLTGRSHENVPFLWSSLDGQITGHSVDTTFPRDRFRKSHRLMKSLLQFLGHVRGGFALSAAQNDVVCLPICLVKLNLWKFLPLNIDKIAIRFTFFVSFLSKFDLQVCCRHC